MTSHRTHEVETLIVGGGPAGSVAGWLLAGFGVETAIVDRAAFPRAKACGEFVNGGGVAALERLGLLDVVRGLDPAPIAGWTMRAPTEQRAEGRYRHGSGFGVPRARLDEALLDAARLRGARVEERQTVTAIEREGSRLLITTRGPDGARRWRTRVLLGADGLRSVVARRLGLIARQPRLRKVSITYRLQGVGPRRDVGHLWFAPHGTVGLAPVHVGAPLWNATAVFYADAWGRVIARGRRGAFVAAMEAAGFRWDGPPEFVEGPWSSGPFDWPVRTPAADGVLLLGDAAGYYDPLTGQGIAHAIRTAEVAAPLAAEIVRAGDRDRIATEYVRRVRGMNASARRVQRVVEAVVAGSISRRYAVRALRGAPGVADRVVDVLGDGAPLSALLRLRWGRNAGVTL